MSLGLKKNEEIQLQQLLQEAQEINKEHYHHSPDERLLSSDNDISGRSIEQPMDYTQSDGSGKTYIDDDSSVGADSTGSYTNYGSLCSDTITMTYLTWIKLFVICASFVVVIAVLISSAHNIPLQMIMVNIMAVLGVAYIVFFEHPPSEDHSIFILGATIWVLYSTTYYSAGVYIDSLWWIVPRDALLILSIIASVWKDLLLTVFQFCMIGDYVYRLRKRSSVPCINGTAAFKEESTQDLQSFIEDSTPMDPGRFPAYQPDPDATPLQRSWGHFKNMIQYIKLRTARDFGTEYYTDHKEWQRIMCIGWFRSTTPINTTLFLLLCIIPLASNNAIHADQYASMARCALYITLHIQLRLVMCLETRQDSAGRRPKVPPRINAAFLTYTVYVLFLTPALAFVMGSMHAISNFVHILRIYYTSKGQKSDAQYPPEVDHGC